MVFDRTDGFVTFRLYRPEAHSVEVRGDFSGWEGGAVPMVRNNAGWWSVTIPVEPGDYLFSYVVDGAIWLPDYAAHGVKRNQFGGWVSCLTVTPQPLGGRMRSLAA